MAKRLAFQHSVVLYVDLEPPLHGNPSRDWIVWEHIPREFTPEEENALVVLRKEWISLQDWFGTRKMETSVAPPWFGLRWILKPEHRALYDDMIERLREGHKSEAREYALVINDMLEEQGVFPKKRQEMLGYLLKPRVRRRSA